MTDDKSQIFDHISKSEITELKAQLTSYNGSVDFTDENGEFALRLLFALYPIKTNFHKCFLEFQE